MTMLQLLLFYHQVQPPKFLSVFLLDIAICCTHLAVAFFQIGSHCRHFICSCIPWALNHDELGIAHDILYCLNYKNTTKT